MNTKGITVEVNIETLFEGQEISLDFVKEAIAEKASRDRDRPNVKYLCDHRACERCSNSECDHTSDIRHAKNFENFMGTFVEVANCDERDGEA